MVSRSFLSLPSWCLLALVGWLASAAPAAAQPAGCRPELSGRVGAQLAIQPLAPGPSGQLAPAGEPTTEIEARSGQTFRLLIRPLEGSARPAGPECPVRVATGRLSSVARLLNRTGFIFDRSSAYGQFRLGEERTLDFEVRPFDEWGSASEKVELDNLTIWLPETTEFAARLPASFRPPPGAVCADVVYTDAQPAAGGILGLAAPPGEPTDRRPVGADGRVCWDGFDPLLFGDLRLEGPAGPGLGVPRSRYVSYETSYRLFVVKRQARDEERGTRDEERETGDEERGTRDED